MDQVAFGFAKALEFATEVGIDAITTFDVKTEIPPNGASGTFGAIMKKTVPLPELRGFHFFKATQNSP